MNRSLRQRGALASLTVETEIPIPGLPPAPDSMSPADVQIVTGTVGLAADGTRSAIDADGTLFLDVPDVARFRIEGGRRITVETHCAPECASHVRTFLLGTAIGTIFHQRGILPLHASTVRVGDVAVAIAGPSGAGKSTLAHALTRAGHALIADDITPVTLTDDGSAWAWPLLPQVKLWRDALDRADISAAGLETIAARLDKFRLPETAAFATLPVPLGAVVVLCDADDEEAMIVPLSGLRGITALRAQVYRPHIGGAVRGMDPLFRDLGRLAARVLVARLDRRRDARRLGSLVQSAVNAVRSHRPTPVSEHASAQAG